MIPTEIPQLIDELLARRREYHLHRERDAAAVGVRLADADYALIWCLLSRLGIRSLHVDAPVVAALFRDAAPAEGMAELSVSLPTDRAVSIPGVQAKPFDRLYLFCPTNQPDPAWLENAAAESALALCYGLTGVLDRALVKTLQAIAGPADDAILVPLFATAPALWHSSSLLIARRSRQATLTELVGQITAVFDSEDLDTLGLAEENLGLRAKVAHLSSPQTEQGELEQLRVALAALRRTALAQEETIAMLRQAAAANGAHFANEGRVRLNSR